MRGKRESGKRRFARKKNSIKKLVITVSKVEKYEVADPVTTIAEVKAGKGKQLKL